MAAIKFTRQSKGGITLSAITWWSVDPLEKVFQDSPAKDAGGPLTMEGARNEWVSGQVVIYSPDTNLMGVRPRATELLPVAGDGAAILRPTLRFAGFVPVRNNTPRTPADHLVRQAPAWFPDPLVEEESLHIRRGCAQPVWITVKIPPDASPGTYHGTIDITTRDGNQATVDVRLHVHPAYLPDDRRLNVTNWFNVGNIASHHGLELFSDGFWRMLAKYAQMMGEHRQNTVITPLQQLIRPALRGDSNTGSSGIELDFTLFDRYVEVFDQFGVAGLIEGGHLGGRRGEWEDGFSVNTWQVDDGSIRVVPVDAGSPQADRFLAWFLPALRDHLERRGWADRYIQHLADEPCDANAKSYNELVRAVRRHWPQIRLVEANMCQTVDPLDIWVPILNVWHQAYDFYCEQQAQGREVWFYTCLGPTGTYANRLIDYPLLKVRLLHWLNAHYGASGYLHWGLNYWNGVTSPFADVEPAHHPQLVLPPGDCGIVYPGPGGPLSSIRFEAMRDGIADYELLQELSTSEPDAARQLTGAVIRDFDDYNLDIAHFRAIRRRLLDAVASAQGNGR